jgi:ATP adenylyltransferase
MAYIEERNSEPGCLFCRRLAEPDGPDNLILHRGSKAFVILNRYPYTNGHLMVVPFDHQASLEDLDAETRAEVMELANRSLRTLRRAYGAEAFNLGINIGAAAGAGVADHVHLHVVPRWGGDTNFMATVAEARVIPEDLRITYARLSEAWRDA